MFSLFFLALSTVDLEMLELGRVQEVPEKDNATITALIEKIKSEKTNCYSKLQDKLQKECANLDEKRRISLAIQIMICEQENDDRINTLPIYQSDEQFTEELDEADLHMFTTYYLNTDIVCYNAASMSQSIYNQKKIDELYKALQTSTKYATEFMMKYHDQNQNFKNKLKLISDRFSESTNALGSVMELITNVQENITQIERSRKYIFKFYSSNKFQFKVLVAAFMLSYILPDVFTPIFFITFLKIFIDGKISITSNIGNRISKAAYCSLCSLVVTVCVYKRITEIKQRIFGSPK